TPTRVRLQQDLNGDGALTASNEDLTYELVGTDLRRTDGVDAPVVLASGLPSGGFVLRCFTGGNPSVELVPAASPAALTASQVANAPGVVNFQNAVGGQWATAFGSGGHAFAPLAGFTYSVAPAASAGSPASAGRFVATALGPRGERNVVVANVTRSNVPLVSP